MIAKRGFDSRVNQAYTRYTATSKTCVTLKPLIKSIIDHVRMTNKEKL